MIVLFNKGVDYMKKEEIEITDNRVRINMTMSQEIVDFYQKLANSMGLPRSTAMVMALKTYMDQQELLEFSKKMPKDGY